MMKKDMLIFQKCYFFMKILKIRKSYNAYTLPYCCRFYFLFIWTWLFRTWLLFFGGDFFTDTIEIEKKSGINESNSYCYLKAEYCYLTPYRLYSIWKFFHLVFYDSLLIKFANYWLHFVIQLKRHSRGLWEWFPRYW